MIKSYIILLISVIFIGNSSTGDIDYNPKALYREYEKKTGNRMNGLAEIFIPDSIAANTEIKGKFFLVKDSPEEFRYLYIGRVNSCRANGCSIDRQPMFSEAFEFFDYFILFSKSKTVQLVYVYNYEATHGQEITARGWLKQFNGFKTGNELTIGKNIDSISGATISVYGITADIIHKTELLENIVQNF